MPFTTDHSIDLYYEIHDPADPADADPIPLLNISGSGNDLRTSKPERHPFNRSFTVAHYDQRGLGQSTIPEEPYTLAEYADDAAALMDHLGWETAHVVGTSFGGMVAQHMALRHPERIERLVLCCTSPGGNHPSFPLHTIEPLDVEAKLELKLGLWDNRWDPGRDEPIPGLWAAFYDQLIEGARHERTGESRRGYQAQLEARSHHDVERRLGRVELETYVCGGAYDDLAPPRNVEVLAEALPNATVELFDGGHFFMVQDRTAFPKMVEFLKTGSPS